MADVYGHIFMSPGQGDIDMEDVILNRRILVIMLPSLEKSGEEIACLGKIFVNSFVAAIHATKEKTLSAPQRPMPFTAIFDEIDYYKTIELETLWSEPNGNNISMIAGSLPYEVKQLGPIYENSSTEILLSNSVSGDMCVIRPGRIRLIFLRAANPFLQVRVRRA